MAIGKPLELSELVCAFKRRLQPFLGAGRSSNCVFFFIFYFDGVPKALGPWITLQTSPQNYR